MNTSANLKKQKKEYKIKLTSETIAKKLTRYGLSADEAEIYIRLLMRGSSPAGALSRTLKINRMKAYRTLKRLEEKGLVETIIGRPMRFSAKPLNELIEGFMETERERLEDLEKAAKEIGAEWEKLKDDQETLDTGPKFRILSGRRQVLDQISQICTRAERSIFIMTTQNDLFRLSYSGLTETFTEMGGKGVDIRILSHITGLDIDVHEYMEVSEIRHMAFPATMRFVLVDQREALTTFTMDDSMSMTTKDDLGLWIDAPDYVKAVSSSMDALWNDSVPAINVISDLNQTQAMMEAMVEIRKTFEKGGWSVEIPGKINIDETQEYRFDLVAKQNSDPKKQILIDLAIREEEVLNQIVLLYAKSMGMESEKKIIITSKPYEEKTKSLAELYGISLVDLEELEVDIQAVVGIPE